MKFKKTSNRIFRWTVVAISATLILSACKKEVQQEQEPQIESSSLSKQNDKPPKKVNPFSHENIKKAKKKLAGQNIKSVSSNRAEEDRLYTYIQFDPNAVTGNLLKQLEEDTTIKILNFPFASGEIYSDSFAIDETKANELADGKLYAVAKKNTAIEIILKTSLSINPVVLDELYLPDEEDTTLQFQAFREAGYTEGQIAQLRICLFKRPSGFVSYLDTDINDGGMRNVPGMQVWGLVFGIPIHTFTDGNGYYRLPWRFVAGTIMGTIAKNNRVNIKPLNTQGAWWLTIPVQFIVGSIYIHGWVSACQMRNDVNIEFRAHRQNRYWAQLMHSVRLHDNYCATDGINNAPQGLVMYAHWDDNYGSASAPMLSHISPTNTLIERFLNALFGGNISLPNNYPTIYNLLNGVLPDITVKTGSAERRSHSARLMQTMFHELGHGSHFRRAGQAYWVDLTWATLRTHPANECGGGYGCGQNPNDGNVAIGESWAEFIGTNHTLRLHPNGEKFSRWAGFTASGTWTSAFIRNSIAIEREAWFFNDWIASGIYNDLMDVTNTWPLEDGWDRTGGLSIQQLYEPLGPSIDFFCEYEWEIISRYGLNQGDVDDIFVNNNAGGCL